MTLSAIHPLLICYTPVGSSLAKKYLTRVEVNDSDKHSRLLLYLINYSRKKATSNYYTVLKVTNTNNGFDYYISFNSDSGITNQISDGINEILMTRRTTGNLSSDSTTIVRLIKEDSYAAETLGL